MSGDCRRCDCIGRRKIHLARSAATREVSVLGADYNLIFGGADPGSGIYAGTTAWLNHSGADVSEHLNIAMLFRVAPDLLGPELNETFHIRMYPLAVRQRILEDGRVHIH